MSRRRSEADRRYWSTPKGKYSKHKANAVRRGVAFSLTFQEWWRIWEQSGKWGKRGNRRGMYQMCRIGDLGGYELGNVYIGKHEQNTADRNRSVVVNILAAGLRIERSVISEEAPF
jgi:hypothetical protein